MKQIILNNGSGFEGRGSGRFAKEVTRVGNYHHPMTGEKIDISKGRQENLTRQSNRYLSNGNTIPFPDGHKYESLSNMGWWRGPFAQKDTRQYSVVEPTDEDALKKIRNKSLDSVSVVIVGPYTDPKNVTYDEVIVQICGTNYPVITEQSGFIALSSLEGGDQVEKGNLFIPMSVLPAEDPKIQLALNAFADAALDYQMGGHTDVPGKPGRTFAACVSAIQKEQGVDAERAQRICGALAKRAGELDWSELADAFDAMATK